MNGLGKRIESIRLNLGMNKTEFGKLFKASGSLVNKWENGNVTPSEERLKQIAKIGNISINELLYGPPEERVTSIIYKEVNKGKFPLNEIALEEAIESVKLFPDNLTDSKEKIEMLYLLELEAEIHVKNKPVIKEIINEYVSENNLVLDDSALEKTVKEYTTVYAQPGHTEDLIVPPIGENINESEVVSAYLDYSNNEVRFNKNELKLMEKITSEYLYKKNETEEITKEEMDLLFKLNQRSQN